MFKLELNDDSDGTYLTSLGMCVPDRIDRKTDMPEQNKHRLTILQWNSDCLTTKVVELSELTVGYGIDIIALQETKLG